jgi:hypothetical protein
MTIHDSQFTIYLFTVVFPQKHAFIASSHGSFQTQNVEDAPAHPKGVSPLAAASA